MGNILNVNRKARAAASKRRGRQSIYLAHSASKSFSPSKVTWEQRYLAQWPMLPSRLEETEALSILATKEFDTYCEEEMAKWDRRTA